MWVIKFDNFFVSKRGDFTLDIEAARKYDRIRAAKAAAYEDEHVIEVKQ